MGGSWYAQTIWGWESLASFPIWVGRKTRPDLRRRYIAIWLSASAHGYPMFRF